MVILGDDRVNIDDIEWKPKYGRECLVYKKQEMKNFLHSNRQNQLAYAAT